MRILIWLTTHLIAGAIGFALAIYLLPILTAPEGSDAPILEQQSASATYTGTLTRDLAGSDFCIGAKGR